LAKINKNYLKKYLNLKKKPKNKYNLKILKHGKIPKK
jgi:hypothetical protein